MKHATPSTAAILAALGWLTALLSVLALHLGDRALWAGQELTFTAPDGARLAATYYPGRQAGGVLLLPGFGSDQTTLRSAANEFAAAGLHVFTFDFAGHGRSAGTLGFDNAQTDRLALETLAAKAEFSRLSGLTEEQIVLVGHSLGARVALQAALIDAQPVAGLALLGAQVNLGVNVQSEVFTGASDAQLDWVQRLGSQQPPSPVLLVSGEWDDILTPGAAQALVCRLSGQDHCAAGQVYGSPGLQREWLLLPALLHNYEPFSPRALSAVKTWSGQRLGIDLSSGAPTAARRVILWISGLGGLALGLAASGAWARQRLPAPERAAGIVLTDSRRFLWGKLLLWLPALIPAALVGSLLFFLPTLLPAAGGVPALNLIYVSALSGYGLVMLLLYRLERAPGARGRLPFEQPAGLSQSGLRLGLTLALTLATFAISAGYARSGWFYVYPINARLVWLALFSLPTTLGFWIGLHEMSLLARAGGSRRQQTALALIGLTPFFAWTAFLAAIGSLSGVTGGVQGLIVLAIALLFGGAVQALAHRPWLTAALQSLLLYWLLLPQGVLFG